MTQKRNKAKAVFSSHHELGNVTQTWTAKLLESGNYEVTNRNGEIREFTDGEEFDVQTPVEGGGVRNRTYRVTVDGNKNLNFTQILKKRLPDVTQVSEDRYAFTIGGNQVELSLGQSLTGKADPKREWTLEYNQQAGPMLVSKDTEFTVLVGENILHGYFAKPSKHASFTVYSTNGDGKLGVYKAKSDGVKTQPATINHDIGKVCFNHNGQNVMVPIRYKAFEKNLLVLKETEQTPMGEAFKCFFNYIVPGQKNKGKDGIPGLLLPAKGNIPARFMEKGPEGELYNTASFFAGKQGKTVNGLTRSTEQARESLLRYQEGRVLNKMKEELIGLQEEIRQIEEEMRIIEVDVNENSDYVEKLPRMQYLESRIPLLTQEAQKQFNSETFGKPESFRVVEGGDVFGIEGRQNNYQRNSERTY